MTTALAIRMAEAALVGLAVGVEREKSGHGEKGPDPRFAGVRTFMLMGAIGGIAGWLSTSGAMPIGVALLAGIALLICASYWRAVRGTDTSIDGTTEVAAVVVVALGVPAGVGEIEVASGAAAIMVLVLAEKAFIRGAVERLTDTELQAALQFAVLALVVLPALPNRSYGPFDGVNPRSLWIVVLIFSGLNFAGYVARKMVGVSRGYGVTGALGGLISSTAVTLHFARSSRRNPELAVPLGVGTVAASTVLLLRVLLVSAVLNPRVALALVPFVVYPAIAGALTIGVLARRFDSSTPDAEASTERSPLGLWSSTKMAFAFQVALMALSFMRSRFGSTGVLTSAALLGLTDMDALTLSMNCLGASTGDVGLAARSIAVGIVANTVLKGGITLALGGPRFRMVALSGLLTLLATGIASLLVAW